jgi:hypothetical protein
MHFDWQNVTAICLVAAALACLLRRIRRAATKKDPQCADCAACGPDRTKRELISLEPLSRRSRP